MADHDPLPVQGYTPVPDFKVDMVNSNKELEELVLQRLDALERLDMIDPRWLAIGRRQIEQGFMAVNRAVFQPTRATLTPHNPTR